MRGIAAVAALALVAFQAVAHGQQPPPPPSVKVGQPAPPFTLNYFARKADGTYEQKAVSLADFKGKKTVVLAFFPAAFSPG